jgi:LuxR family maltose regulon positive regulatory protein
MALVQIELAKAYVALSDTQGARSVLREMADIVRQRPNLGLLPTQAHELSAALSAARATSPGASSLTAAELRLVPYLATHLTFREIGERLYVSRHTVKTQAMAIYRKLGVGSRSESIEALQGLGLLGR